MKSKLVMACALVLLQFGLGSTFAGPIVSSHFDSNAEGWQLENDATTAPNPIYSPSGGNPGGAIEGIDQELGGTWRFVAPAAYLGNESAAYGGVFSFDLRYTLNGGATLVPFDASYVLISNGPLILGYVASPYPVPGVWTHFDIPLTAPGWAVGGSGGPPATAAQMQAVLANLTSLRVRGEYNNGPDLAFLDNVVLATPEPGIAALIGIGFLGLGFARRPRRNIAGA